MEKIEYILNNLKEKGFRMTEIRREILKTIAKSKKPLDYFGIKKDLLKRKKEADKATIYREISFLKEQGIIKELRFKSAAKFYEILSDHHHHIVCTECESIDHVKLEENLDKEEEIIAKKNNFKILNHSLEFYGICEKCQV